MYSVTDDSVLWTGGDLVDILKPDVGVTTSRLVKRIRFKQRSPNNDAVPLSARRSVLMLEDKEDSQHLDPIVEAAMAELAFIVLVQ